MKNQVNPHMYWLSKIVNYSGKNDLSRMVSGKDLPEMCLLAKDHKPWSE